jgi:hypothetical protein
MAQFESNTGDQPNSPTNNPKNKQNNVTEFNSPQTKESTPGSTANRETSSSMDRGMGASRTSGTGGAATATAKSFIDQAKETAGQAYDAVTDKAATKLDQQKSTLTESLTTVADSVRQVGNNLGSSRTESGLAEAAAKYTNTAAQKLEDVAGYFENRNVREMARDLEGFARRNPAVFLGAAFGLGFLAARFLKSTNPGYETPAGGRELSTPAANINEPNFGKGGSPNFEAKPV